MALYVLTRVGVSYSYRTFRLYHRQGTFWAFVPTSSVKVVEVPVFLAVIWLCIVEYNTVENIVPYLAWHEEQKAILVAEGLPRSKISIPQLPGVQACTVPNCTNNEGIVQTRSNVL